MSKTSLTMLPAGSIVLVPADFPAICPHSRGKDGQAIPNLKPIPTTSPNEGE